jgi:thiol-disulfide isomerase/thioredoxin
MVVLLNALGGSLPQESEALILRQVETDLLHRFVNMKGLRQWQARQQQWVPASVPAAPLLIVHIWAVECRPCVAELPVLLKVSQAFLRNSKVKGAQFLFITESDDGVAREYQHEHEADFGNTSIYRADERLRQSLGTLRQPLTLLVDSHGEVRHAFVGSLLMRRSELVLSIERLLPWTSEY